MKNLKNKAFTLVELLVVITILTILSVVAYQSFGGATDKAQNVVKKENMANLGSTLQLFYTTEHYYPMPQAKSTTNLWGYDSSTNATISNKIKVIYNDQEVKSIVTADTLGGGKIMGINGNSTNQIGAKGVIGRIGGFNKKYLKKDIYDTQLGDTKVLDIDGSGTKGKMIDLGIGKYTYAVYARASAPASWNTSGAKGTFYELATTFKDLDGEGYITHLEGNYSKDEFSNPTDYPDSLIGLKEGDKDKNVATTVDDQGIPYPIDGFAK